MKKKNTSTFRLKDKYLTEVVPAMMNKFGYKNVCKNDNDEFILKPGGELWSLDGMPDYLMGYYLGDLRKSRKNASTLKVTEAALNVMKRIHIRLYIICATAFCCEILNIGSNNGIRIGFFTEKSVHYIFREKGSLSFQRISISID